MQQPSFTTQPIPPPVFAPGDLPVLAPEYVGCAWCWTIRHPGVPFPEEQSSTICPACQEAVLARYKTKPAREAVSGGSAARPCG